MSNNNLNAVERAMEMKRREIIKAVENASDEIAKRVEGIAKNMVLPDRAVVGYPAVSGEPPRKVSGNLMNNIKGKTKRLGFGIYKAEVGSYMIYARVLELGGNPNWTKGQKFPYLAPSVRQFQQANGIKKVLVKHLRGVIK